MSYTDPIPSAKVPEGGDRNARSARKRQRNPRLPRAVRRLSRAACTQRKLSRAAALKLSWNARASAHFFGSGARGPDGGRHSAFTVASVAVLLPQLHAWVEAAFECLLVLLICRYVYICIGKNIH